MKRACIGLSIAIAFAAVAYLIFSLNSLNLAVRSAGYSPNDVVVLERGFNANDREFMVIKTSKVGNIAGGNVAGDILALVYLEKNNIGLWTVTENRADASPGTHLVSIGWINSAGIRRFEVREELSFSNEWHILYYGNNAIQRIAIAPEQLPAGTAFNIQQAESDFSIHLITYEPPEILNQIDMHSLLINYIEE